MIAEPTCYARRCKHFIGILQDKDDDGEPIEITERPYCAAFPNGIPEEIAYGDNLHEQKHKDQEGKLLYEKAKDVDYI